MALQRKKITVRTKRGRTYQRSMMVQAQAIGRRASKSGKLHALNPWEQRHTEHVSTNSALGERAKAYGSSGPGSTHSWLALAVGAAKARSMAGFQGHIGDHADDSRSFAAARRMAGRAALPAVTTHIRRELNAAPVNGHFAAPTHARAGAITRTHTVAPSMQHGWATQDVRHHLINTYGRSNVEHIENDDRKWVR